MPARTAVSNDCINQIFREARTHNVWLPGPVSSELLRQGVECGGGWLMLLGVVVCGCVVLLSELYWWLVVRDHDTLVNV